MRIRKLRKGFEVCLGEEMWTCRNGKPNYRYHLDFSFRSFNEWMLGGAFGIPHSIEITPSLILLPWRKSVLASDKTIGNTYRSITVQLKWLGFDWEATFGFNVNTKRTLNLWKCSRCGTITDWGEITLSRPDPSCPKCDGDHTCTRL